MLSRLLWGVGPTLAMVILVAAVRLILGTVIGLTAGWSQRGAGRFCDGLIRAALAIPVIMIALGGIAAVGVEYGVWAFVVGLSLTGWVDAARIIMESEEELELAAVVAYEHHIMLNGGGYPTVHYPRECTLASRLVHVCDVFDALSTTRPYREAWPLEKVLAYLEERGGTEFDPELVGAFNRMMRASAAQVRVLSEESTV